MSDEVHSLVMDLVAMCDDGGTPTLPQGDPAQNLGVARRRSLPCSATIASAALVTAVGSNSARGVNSGFCQTFDRRVVMVLR